jgi:hypothetical protein
MTEEEKKNQIDWNSTGSVLTFLAKTMQGLGYPKLENADDNDNDNKIMNEPNELTTDNNDEGQNETSDEETNETNDEETNETNDGETNETSDEETNETNNEQMVEKNDEPPTREINDTKTMDSCTESNLINKYTKKEELVAKRKLLLKELINIDNEISKCPEDIVDFSKILF